MTVSWRDWDDPFVDGDPMCWEPEAGRENDETRGWRLRETDDGPRMTFAHARRLAVEAAGGVYECRWCAKSFADRHAGLCDMCRRPRGEWLLLTQQREAA